MSDAWPTWATVHVKVVDADPGWPVYAADLIAPLGHRGAPLLDGEVEHVGSTAVPGASRGADRGPDGAGPERAGRSCGRRRTEYAAIKRGAAARFADDRKGYLQVKSDFIERVVAEARA